MTKAYPITFVSADDYNNHWENLRDFIRYNPGARHRRRMVLQLLEGLEFSSCLDVGCGTGEFLGAISAKYPSVAFTGGDYCEQVLARNQQLFPACEFALLDIEEGVLDRRYDLIVCSEVLEHLHKQNAAFYNLASMLNPGGHLVLTCPSGKVFKTEQMFGHLSHPTAFEISRLANYNHLTIQKHWTWGFPFYLLTKWLTNLNPKVSMRNFAAGRYSWPQKAVCTSLYWLNFFNLKRSSFGCQTLCLMQKRA